MQTQSIADDNNKQINTSDSRIIIRELDTSDYQQVYLLWSDMEGIVLRPTDARNKIEEYLSRNEGLSFVAIVDNKVIGAILCGHDGRCGYIYHLAVSSQYRRKGVGRRLVAEALNKLISLGISRCHLFVLSDNHPAIDFWQRIGYSARNDLVIMTFDTKDKKLDILQSIKNGASK